MKPNRIRRVGLWCSLGLWTVASQAWAQPTPRAEKIEATAADTAKRKAEEAKVSPDERRYQAAFDLYRQLRQPSQAMPEVIYGADNRLDTYQVTDPLQQDLLESVVVVVDTSSLTNNGNGTYTLSTSRWTTQGGLPVCESEPFRNQMRIGFCSGFMVGTDLIATAGHCVSSGDIGSVAFVFGFDQLGPTTDPLTIVPADNVYIVTNVVTWAQSGGLDYCVARVDRPIVGRTPLEVRRSGALANGDPLVMIGHPSVLPKKTEAGGVVQNASADPGYFTANVDAYGGNSGSMVANRLTGVVEGILVRGNSDYTTSGGCTVSRVCPDTGCPGFEEISRATTFSAAIPELGLTIQPGGGTTHIGVVGGPFTNPTVSYTMSNPTSGPLSYAVSLVGGGSAPVLINGSPSTITGTLPPGANTAVVVTLDSSATALPAGVYATTVNFRDVTNSRDLPRVHTVEIGQTGFDTSPAAGLTTGGPLGGPFAGTAAYTITSNRPTPVTVRVTPNQPWITVNGSAGPVDFNLNGAGTSAAVTLGIGGNAAALAAGVYTGSVSFDNLAAAAGDTARQVNLEVGRVLYASGNVPRPITDNTTVDSVLTIADNLCIADLNVSVDITHTYRGDLTVDLISPAGTIVRLANRTGAGADNIVATYDQGVLNPDGPGALTAFTGESAQGTWTLRVRDNASSDTGTLNSWSLALAPGACVSRTTVYSFNFDANPGWTTQGAWAFGTPTGGGSSGGDPTGGYTGSNVYGFNLAGDYASNIASTQYLTTTALDLTGVTGAQLRFRRWLGIESSTYDKAFIDLSTNGTTWTNLWTHASGSFNDAAWTLVAYDIPAADNAPTVYIRWGLGPTDSSVTYPGWNIDDVEISGIVAPSCPADFTADGFVDDSDFVAFAAAYDAFTVPPANAACDLTADGFVDDSDFVLFAEAYDTFVCP